MTAAARRPLALLLSTLIAALAVGGVAGAGSADYTVGLGHKRATLGDWAQDGVRDPIDLQDVFGRADGRRRDEFSCRLRWRRIGLRADFTTFGAEDANPCRVGTFIQARLTQRRWVTPNGIRKGVREGRVRKVAKRHCTRNRCGIRGYVLELHRSPCAGRRVPGVVAVVRGGRVEKLVTYWRGCE